MVIDVDLTTEQIMAMKEINHNLQIVACAGSGKTEVITRRIANILKKNPDIAPKNIVAFTFTEKAAQSLKTRILKVLEETSYANMDAVKSMYVGTIHGFCFYLLKEYSDKFKDFKILDTVKNHLFVTRYWDKCGMNDLELEPHLNNIRLFGECIDKMVDDYDNYGQWETLHHKVFEKYRSCLYEHQYLDFSLLILETVEQVKCNPAIAQYLSDIKYLVVDEYQDVDNLQEKLIYYFSEFGANICVVGDDDQTIYQFRGSNADNMIQFTKKYPNVTQIKLEKNFRCASKIVDIADCVIRNNYNRLDKKMCSEADRSGVAKAEQFDSPEEQYSTIAERIAEIHKNGVPYKEIAVLVRKGKYINPICEALKWKSIPYATDSADYFFNGQYFRRFVEILKALVNVNKSQLYNCWKEYVVETQFNTGFKYLRQIARSGGNGFALPLSSVIQEFLEKTGFLNSDVYDIQVRIDDLSGFMTILNDYDEIYCDYQLSARISGLLKFLEKRALEEYKYHSFQSKEFLEDAVQIMTIHKSKGLEFHTVFLPNMMEKEFPVSNQGGKKYWHVLGGIFEKNKDKFKNDTDDERKLFYVAVTRTKENLYLYYELSKKNLSTFVIESAASNSLEIDRRNLMNSYEMEELRQKLITHIYAMASSGIKAVLLDLDEIKQAEPEELLKIARRYGF